MRQEQNTATPLVEDPDSPSFQERLREFCDTVGRAGGEVFSAGSNLLGASFRAAADGLNDGIDWTERKVELGAQATTEILSRFITTIAADPDVGRSVMEDLCTLAPGVGAVKIYADSWALYQKGQAVDNEELCEAARRECLKACIHAAVDGATLGVTVLSRSATLTRLAVIATALHAVGQVPSVESALIDPLIKSSLEKPEVRRMVELILNAVKPPTTAQAAPQTPQPEPAA